MKHSFLAFSLCLLFSQSIIAKQTITLQPADGDMTLTLRKALETVKDKDLELVFEKGTYHFYTDYAVSKYCFITNHENGWKNIIFPMENFASITIKGNGAALIFRGPVLPFLFQNCDKVTMDNLSIDWDIPFLFEGKVLAVNEQEGWIDLQAFKDGYSWNVHKGELVFPNIDGFKYSSLGSSLPFDAKEKRVTHGAYDMNSQPTKVEKRANGVLRIHEEASYYPPIGSIKNYKGPKGENRYAPAIHVISSSNIRFEKVVVHHALGMGFLLERSETATLSNCGVYLKEGTTRVVSSTADATHFCNCKGDILVENCRFENMLDDATNVHGTYVAVDEILDEHTARIKLKHFQQMGFEFAGEGDEVWLIHQPNPQRAATNTVAQVKVLNDRFTELRFKDKLPANLKKGDLIKNKTWNPTFTMRGCTMRNHRARNIVLKTPEKIVIEDNDFSSMMSAIFFRGESFYWFESGNVEDVLIRNNRFDYCAYSGMEHAILYITPRLGKSFDDSIYFDRNIRFENNIINTFDQRIVWADRVDGLSITGNKITQRPTAPALYPNASLFDLKHCRNVQISNNSYDGKYVQSILADEGTKKTLKVEGNSGF